MSEPEARILRECFAKIHSFVKPLALSNPDGFVLKPQREGGGHNLYGAEMVQFINDHPDQLPAYILMQRIRPQPSPARLVRGGQVVEVAETISELGIYGIWLSDEAGRVILNQDAGHLCRTKPATVDEGGVWAGHACLASVSLI